MQLIFPKHDSGLGIYRVSKPVQMGGWRKAARIGQELYRWLKEQNGSFEGLHHTAFAISHSQVEAEEPLQLFALSPEMVSRWSKGGKVNSANYYFPSPVIANARIIESPPYFMVKQPKRDAKRVGFDKVEVHTTFQEVKQTNEYAPQEACMSFPKRTAKGIKRLYRIKVRYWYLNRFGIWLRRTEWVEGLKAHILQHEIDHANAINMYYSK